MVISLDQMIADIGPLGRALDTSPAVIPYPATVIPQFLIILHGEPNELAIFASPPS